MSTLSLRLPNSLHRQFRELAKREGISINQFISSAVGEKVAALMTAQYLAERAKRGSREKLEVVLWSSPRSRMSSPRTSTGSDAGRTPL